VNEFSRHILLNELERAKRKKSFAYFYRTYFSQAIEAILPFPEKDYNRFVWGKHLQDFSERLQKYDHTVTLASRKFGKTSTFMAYCAWKMYVQVRKYYEVLYFSSVYDVAFHTISLLKRMLRHLEWYEGEWEPASDSEGNLWCRTRDGREFKVIPWGFL